MNTTNSDEETTDFVVLNIVKALAATMTKLLPEGFNFAITVYDSTKIVLMTDDADSERLTGRLNSLVTSVLQADEDQTRH